MILKINLLILIFIISFNPIKSLKIKKHDIETFRDPEKFTTFLNIHQTNFSSAIEAMDKVIFQEGNDNETIKELRDIQRRLQRAEKFVTKIEKASEKENPTSAVIYDIVRLILDIGPMVFDLIKYLIDLFPADLEFMSIVNSAMNFLEHLMNFSNNFFENLDFNKRKNAYLERIDDAKIDAKKMNDENVEQLIEKEFDKQILDE